MTPSVDEADACLFGEWDMTQEVFNPGDRVRTQKGFVGTVVSTNGSLVQVQLDSSLRIAVAAAVLKRIDEKEH